MFGDMFAAAPAGRRGGRRARRPAARPQPSLKSTSSAMLAMLESARRPPRGASARVALEDLWGRAAKARRAAAQGAPDEALREYLGVVAAVESGVWSRPDAYLAAVAYTNAGNLQAQHNGEASAAAGMYAQALNHVDDMNGAARGQIVHNLAVMSLLGGEGAAALSWLLQPCVQGLRFSVSLRECLEANGGRAVGFSPQILLGSLYSLTGRGGGAAAAAPTRIIGAPAAPAALAAFTPLNPPPPKPRRPPVHAGSPQSARRKPACARGAPPPPLDAGAGAPRHRPWTAAGEQGLGGKAPCPQGMLESLFTPPARPYTARALDPCPPESPPPARRAPAHPAAALPMELIREGGWQELAHGIDDDPTPPPARRAGVLPAVADSDSPGRLDQAKLHDARPPGTPRRRGSADPRSAGGVSVPARTPLSPVAPADAPPPLSRLQRPGTSTPLGAAAAAGGDPARPRTPAAAGRAAPRVLCACLSVGGAGLPDDAVGDDCVASSPIAVEAATTPPAVELIGTQLPSPPAEAPALAEPEALGARSASPRASLGSSGPIGLLEMGVPATTVDAVGADGARAAGGGLCHAEHGGRRCLLRRYARDDRTGLARAAAAGRGALARADGALALQHVLVAPGEVGFLYEPPPGAGDGSAGTLSAASGAPVAPQEVAALVRSLVVAVQEAYALGGSYGAALHPRHLVVPGPAALAGVKVAAPELWAVPAVPAVHDAAADAAFDPPEAAGGVAEETADAALRGDMHRIGTVAQWALGKLTFEDGEAAAWLLAPLVDALAHPDPAARPLPLAVLRDAALWRDLGSWHAARRCLVAPAQKIALFRGYMSQLIRDRMEYFIVIRRECIVHDGVEALLAMDEADMLSPLNVTFIGESAVDYGGVANEFCAEFVKHFMQPEGGAFESEVDGALKQRFLPSPAAATAPFVALGRLLKKCLIDGRSLHLPIAPALFAYLLAPHGAPLYDTLDAWLDALRAYDHAHAAHLSETRAAIAARGEGYLRSLTLYDRRDAPVLTAAAFAQYAVDACEEKLVLKRKEQLDAARRGFEAVELPKEVLRLLTAKDLFLLLCGEDGLNGDALLANVEFRNWHASDSTPYHLCALLAQLGVPELRLFLRLCTGLTSLPHGGLTKKISVFKAARLYSHTCFNQLSLPEYSSAPALHSALQQAFSSLSISPALEDDQD